MSALTQKAIDQLEGLIGRAQLAPGVSANQGRLSISTQAATAADASTTERMEAGTGGTILKEVEEVFRVALAKAFPGVDAAPMISPNRPKDQKYGDYQCNNAMKLFNQLKGQEGCPKNPRAIGQAILEALPSTRLISETPTMAGPGFINIRINHDYISSRISDMLKTGMEGWAPRLPFKRAVVDFSSPNVAKEMHVGHLRSTIIGDTICRTLEYCRVPVLRLNHVGDWGTQFGMLIQHIDESRPGGLAGGGGTTVEAVGDLQELYKNSKKRFDEDEVFKKKAREAVKELQGGNPLYVQAWEKICEASRIEFELIYQRLGVTIQERGESYYNPLLAPLVSELLANGVAEESDGAKVVYVDGIKVPLMIQKSDGGFGYGTTDMAAIRNRIQQEECDFLVYVTDLGQASHFQQVFGAAKKAGFWKEDEVRIDHVGFGIVLNEDGTRIKTRAGRTVRLADLLDEAKSRCKESIRARREEKGDPIDDEELERSAAVMGYAAIKYFDLKNNRKTDYKFNYDAMLNFNGDTAVYLLYSHARIASILRKAEASKGVSVDTLKEQSKLQLLEPAEVTLGVHLVRFPEAIEEVLEEMMPNRLTDYLYELSQKFTHFYSECQVVGSEQEASRILLCQATAIVMRQCFQLLGMTPLYKI